MEDEVYEKYKLAGKIASKAREEGAKLIKPGVSLLKVANKIESDIKKQGAGIAFPVNLSINEIAAHYTPIIDDKKIFKKGDVVKLDVGVHIDGYIADTAKTIEIGTKNYTDMIKASSDALDAAIEMMKPGINLGEVGKKIEETIQSYDYKPVDNLTGHSLEKYNLHSGISVPNINTKIGGIQPKEETVLAIEPFVTNGRGHINSNGNSNIYLSKKMIRARFVRDTRSKILHKKIKTKFNTLPFAQRWCKEIFPTNIDIILKRLTHLGLIQNYPQLKEQNNAIVTQKEHTVILKENSCEVTTV